MTDLLNQAHRAVGHETVADLEIEKIECLVVVVVAFENICMT